ENERRIVEVREALIHQDALLLRYDRVRPVQQRLAQIRLCEAEAGDASELDDFPERPDIWLRDTAAAIADRESERVRLERRREDLQVEVDALSADDRTLLSHAPSLRGVLAERSAFHDR